MRKTDIRLGKLEKLKGTLTIYYIKLNHYTGKLNVIIQLHKIRSGYCQRQ